MGLSSGANKSSGIDDSTDGGMSSDVEQGYHDLEDLDFDEPEHFGGNHGGEDEIGKAADGKASKRKPPR